MSIQFLKDDIKNKSFRKVYMITGTEAYLKKYYVDAIKRGLLTPEEETVDLCVFDGEKLSAEEFTENVRAFPLAAAKKLFILTDAPLSSPVFSALIEFPDILSDDVCLIIYCDAEKFDKRKTEYKALEKFVKENGLSVSLDTPSKGELTRWAVNYLKKRDTQISPQNSGYLIESVTPDMNLLKNEMDKLISYVSDKKKIEKADIDMMVTKSYDVPNYEVTNAIFEKNYEKAYDSVKKLFVSNVYPMIVLYTIENAISTVVKVKMLLSQGKTQSEIASVLNLSSYPAQKNCEIAVRLSEEKLYSMLDCCIEADIASKSTSVSLEDLVYKLIAECISKL